MKEKRGKQTILLVAIMIACIVLTSLLLTNSLQCADCNGKITGKYYLSLLDRPYCKSCGTEYYRGFPGDLDNFSYRVDNALRNILVIVELVGFVGAVIVINKKQMTEVIKKEKEREISHLDDFVEKKDTPRTDSVMADNPVENSALVRKTTLITTFKTKTEEDIKPIKDDSHSDSDWFTSAGDL